MCCENSWPAYNNIPLRVCQVAASGLAHHRNFFVIWRRWDLCKIVLVGSVVQCDVERKFFTIITFSEFRQAERQSIELRVKAQSSTGFTNQTTMGAQNGMPFKYNLFRGLRRGFLCFLAVVLTLHCFDFFFIVIFSNTILFRQKFKWTFKNIQNKHRHLV